MSLRVLNPVMLPRATTQAKWGLCIEAVARPPRTVAVLAKPGLPHVTTPRRGRPCAAGDATCHYPTQWQSWRSQVCHSSLPHAVAVLAKPGLPHDFNSTNTDMGHYTIPIITIIDTTNNTTNTYNNTFLISHSPTLSDIPLNNTQLRLGPHRPAPQCPSRLLQQHIHLHHYHAPSVLSEYCDSDIQQHNSHPQCNHQRILCLPLPQHREVGCRWGDEYLQRCHNPQTNTLHIPQVQLDKFVWWISSSEPSEIGGNHQHELHRMQCWHSFWCDGSSECW